MYYSARQVNAEFMKRLSSFFEKAEMEAILKEIRLKYPALNPINEGKLNLDAELYSILQDIMGRLEKQEPLYYILGRAPFMQMEIGVSPAVLIPRPETEELVTWGLEETEQIKKKVLDICCGSGCIAFGLRKYGDWDAVAGLDVSKAALQQAMRNAKELKLDVTWIEADILKMQDPGIWDVWISNPPYVCRQEQKSMDDGVLKYEPHEALFVPDLDPLIFYRKILNLSQIYLKPGGRLLFEVNSSFALEVQELMKEKGFGQLEIRKDVFGKNRMVGGRKL